MTTWHFLVSFDRAIYHSVTVALGMLIRPSDRISKSQD